MPRFRIRVRVACPHSRGESLDEFDDVIEAESLADAERQARDVLDDLIANNFDTSAEAEPVDREDA